MNVSQATKYCPDYHTQNSKKNTAINYQLLLSRFNEQFGERDLHTITSEKILAFLTHLNEKTKQTNKCLRYALLNTFFNLIKNTLDEKIPNPCDTVMLRKIFRNTNRNCKQSHFEAYILIYNPALFREG